MNLFSRLGTAVKYAATGRLSSSVLVGGFEGAMMHRRLIGWKATQENLNGLLAAGGDVLRARARQIVRANPYASNAADSFVANAVGAGIKPSSLVQDTALKAEIHRVWNLWTDDADADGLTDFYGLQALATRAMFEAGECFIRFRPRRPEDGLLVPLQIQLLESEMLPLSKNEIAPYGNLAAHQDSGDEKVESQQPDELVKVFDDAMPTSIKLPRRLDRFFIRYRDIIYNGDLPIYIVPIL